MIEFSITGQEEVIANLRGLPMRIESSVERRMQQVVITLRDRIVALKLSGQVLRNRTGTLRRSITAEVERTTGEITGIVGVSNKAWYGKLHEYGGTFTVATHLRRSKLRATGTYVRAHQVHFKERSFMRSAFRESQDSIRRQINLAVEQAVNG